MRYLARALAAVLFLSLNWLATGLMLAMVPAASAWATVIPLPDVIIFSGINVGVGNGALIEGSIQSNNNITINAGATVQGNLFADNLASTGAGATVTGSINQGAAVSDLPLITMQDIVDNLNSKGISFTTLALNTNYIADNNPIAGHITTPGIYLVDGTLTIASTFTGDGTFITNGTITVNNGATLTGLVPISDLFPQGLALYSGTGTVSFGGTGGNIGDGALITTGAIYGALNVTINANDQVHKLTTTDIPEPASLLLLAIGVGALGLTARRKRKDQN